MELVKVKEILQNWDVVSEKIESVYRSAWDIDGKYILKHGSDITEIEKSILLSTLLSEEGIPVASYFKTADRKPFLTVEDGYWCLMGKLSGIHLDVYKEREDFPIELGKILARLHIALRKIEQKFCCTEGNMINELECYILPEIIQKQLPVSDEMTDYVQGFLRRNYDKLPRQLIHRDMHMGNLLFENGMLSGYIDFDLSVKNVRIFDLCYFSLSFLIGKTQQEDISRKWKNIFSAILQGYQELLPLCDLELNSFKYIMLDIELLFVAFWSKQNNMEQLQEAKKMADWIWENIDF